jgi:hypothetical protein
VTLQPGGVMLEFRLAWIATGRRVRRGVLWWSLLTEHSHEGSHLHPSSYARVGYL